jgi:large subunit ribosomal protein L10
MAKTRQQKAEIVASIADRLTRMKGAAFSKASSYTMEDANALREAAAAAGVEVFVAKKTLLTLAAKQAGIELSKDALDGSILAAVGMNDEVSAAKLLKDLSKKKQSITLVAGILEGNVISKDEVERLAALPTKEQLLGQLVGTLNAPVSGFVNVLAGNLRGLVTVLSAVQEKKA